jgi:uncharacterized membrane protein YheB (UPF0754 family)
MDITIKVDDARIIREVMKGLETKEIEQGIIREIKDTIFHNVAEKALSKIDYSKYQKLTERYFEEDLLKELAKEIKKKSADKVDGIIKALKENDKINDLLANYFWDILNNFFNETGITLNVVMNGKKMKSVYQEMRNGR